VDCIINFFYMLECTEMYHNATAFVSIESNLSWALANRIQNVIAARRGSMQIIFVNRDTTGQGREGTWLTDQLKEIMVNGFTADLSNGCIKFAREFISRDAEGVKKKLKDQMGRFRKYLKPSVVAGTNTTLNRGGTLYKYDGKVNGLPDDLILAAMMAVEYAKQTMGSDEYRLLAQRNGWR